MNKLTDRQTDRQTVIIMYTPNFFAESLKKETVASSILFYKLNLNLVYYICFQCHTGILGGGHYVCYAKNPNSKWYLYNDSSCKVRSCITVFIHYFE